MKKESTIAKDLLELINQLKQLIASDKFLTRCDDDSYIVGSRENHKFCKIFVSEEGKRVRPLRTPYKVDLYTIIPGIEIGKNLCDTIHGSDKLYYQIYGINFGDTFEIEELCKKNRDMSYFESYFREEALSNPNAGILLNEIQTILNNYK